MLAKKLFEHRKNNTKKDDPFKKVEFTSLEDMAILVVAQNYEKNPELKDLNPLLKKKIIDMIKTDYPICYTSPFINDEQFWERSCKEQFSHQLIKLEQHGNNWKQAFLELHMQQYLQDFEDQDNEDLKHVLLQELKFTRNYIFNLNLTYMQSMLDFVLIIKYLPLLQNLKLNYTIKKDKINIANFKQTGIKLQEADILGHSLKFAQNLLSLTLSDNQIDDDIVRLLINNGLNLNISLQHLDLSHNKITSEGGKKIAKFLKRNEILTELDLCDNLIGLQGMKFIGHALKFNMTLQQLNLKLNKVCDQSGERFFKDIQQNKSLTHLNLSSNSMSFLSADKISDYISNPLCTLKYLDISANNFSQNSYQLLQVGFNKNVSLLQTDIRQSEFDNKKNEKVLMETIVKHKLNNVQKIPFIGKDEFIDWKQRAYLQQQELAEKQQKEQADKINKENF